MPTQSLIKDPVRYKTVMCENWTKHGACPYGFKCQFAHGQVELRARPREQRKVKAKENVHPSHNNAQTIETGKANFLREFLSRGATATPPTTSALAQRAAPLPAIHLTPICSPCSSREPSPRPSMTDPTSTGSAPPGLAPLPPPPGLGAPRAAAPVERPALPVLGPIDFATQAGAAGRFSCGSSGDSLVPQAVSSLWDAPRGEEAGEASPLRCNRHSGKVEPAAPARSAAPEAVPWVTRRISSAQELVRRSVSFVLGGLDEISAEPSVTGRARSFKRVSFGLHAHGRSTSLDEASQDSMASRRSAAASPYPEWA